MLFKKPLVVPAHTVDGSHTSRNSVPFMNCSGYFEVMLIESLKEIRIPFFESVLFFLNYDALRIAPQYIVNNFKDPTNKAFSILYICTKTFYQLPLILTAVVPSVRSKAAQQMTHYMKVKSGETIINRDRLVVFSNKHGRG